MGRDKERESSEREVREREMKSMLNEREALILKEAEATATARSFPHSSLSFPHNPTAIPEGDEGYPDQLMRTG